MGIERVRRWQWVVVSLVVGVAVAEARRALPTPLASYGAELSDQKTFESALVGQYQGRRLFHDVVVYPVEVNVGGQRSLKHFVTGQYFDGRPKNVGGSWRATWRTYCFVAGVPFHPMTKGEAEDPARRTHDALVESTRRTLDPEHRAEPSPVAKASPALPEAAPPSSGPPTVLDYLARVSREQDVAYTYAWWAHPGWQRTIWVGGSFLVIGVIWPTCVNVLSFGSLRRPADDAPTFWQLLAGIRRRRPSGPPDAPLSDPASTEQFADALEAQLATKTAAPARSDASPATASELEPFNTRLQPLARADDGASVPAEPGGDHHYAAKEDDYYPTEKGSRQAKDRQEERA